jgi:hypothetical protein
MRQALIVLLTMTTVAGTAAQWVKYPTPGVPRLPDGGVDVNAPAPTGPEGRPDFSGLWTGARTLADPARAGKPGCTSQEPLPVQAIHIALNGPDDYQRLGAAQLNLFELVPYHAGVATLVDPTGVTQPAAEAG